MRKILWVLTLGVLLSTAQYLHAETPDIDILGLRIPVFSGAVQDSGPQQHKSKASLVAYTVKKPLNEVVSFYQAFLKDNDFLLLGGVQNDGSFDAAVKKGSVGFSLRVFTRGQDTVIQFIW